MTNSTSITIKPGTLSLNHLFESTGLGQRFGSPTTHMREWSKADRYVAPDLAAIQALIGEGGFDEVVQFDMAAHG
jgi:hypothetical protein